MAKDPPVGACGVVNPLPPTWEWRSGCVFAMSVTVLLRSNEVVSLSMWALVDGWDLLAVLAHPVLWLGKADLAADLGLPLSLLPVMKDSAL